MSNNNVVVEINYSIFNSKRTKIMNPKIVKGVNQETLELELEDVDVVKEGYKYTLFVPQNTLIFTYIRSGSWSNTSQLWAILQARQGVQEEKVSLDRCGIIVNNADIIVATGKENKYPVAPEGVGVKPSEVAKQIGRPVKAGSQTLAAWLILNNYFTLKSEESVPAEIQEQQNTTSDLVYLDIDKIKVPSWARNINRNYILESVVDKGIIKPLIVAKIQDKYVLVDGVGRLDIAKVHGINKVPARIIDVDSEEQAILLAIELEATRETWSLEYYIKVINELEKRGYSKTKIAQILKIPRSKLYRILGIASLEDEQIKSYFLSCKLPLRAIDVISKAKETLNPEKYKQYIEYVKDYPEGYETIYNNMTSKQEQIKLNMFEPKQEQQKEELEEEQEEKEDEVEEYTVYEEEEEESEEQEEEKESVPAETPNVDKLALEVARTIDAKITQYFSDNPDLAYKFVSKLIEYLENIRDQLAS